MFQWNLMYAILGNAFDNYRQFPTVLAIKKVQKFVTQFNPVGLVKPLIINTIPK
jgi:hypothetical protein